MQVLSTCESEFRIYPQACIIRIYIYLQLVDTELNLAALTRFVKNCISVKAKFDIDNTSTMELHAVWRNPASSQHDMHRDVGTGVGQGAVGP